MFIEKFSRKMKSKKITYGKSLPFFLAIYKYYGDLYKKNIWFVNIHCKYKQDIGC